MGKLYINHPFRKLYLKCFCYILLLATGIAIFIPAHAQNVPLAAKVQTTQGVNWVVKDAFEQKVFIENKGQCELPGKPEAKSILFYARQNGLQYYFTPTGILISRIVSSKRTESQIEKFKERLGEKDDDHDGDDGSDYSSAELFHEMNFAGANPRITITGDTEVSWHYNYIVKNANVQAHAWKKLIYHDLYPGIDMVFYFPADRQAGVIDNSAQEGFEYSFIVHPGADISQIKIQYNGNLKYNLDGSITTKSPYGNFTDLAPVAKLTSSNKEIKCNFSISHGTIKFTTEDYDRSEELLIDPFSIVPHFTGQNNAYDLDWDYAGNVYVYGGTYPWQIEKYNSAGTMLWSFTSIFGGNDQYLGDFAVDKKSESVYVTEGRDAVTGAIVQKLNSAGTKIAQYNGDNDFNEMWKIAFSTCSDQAVIAGGGSTTPSYTASYLDTNLTTLSLVNTLNDVVAGYHDMWDLALDNFGNSYMVTAHSLYSPVDADSFDNVLLKLPLPSLVPTTWMVKSNYNLLEHGSLAYGLNGASQPGNGFNGMTVSNITLYTYDSYILKQWGTAVGNLTDSIIINTPVNDSTIHWGGLTSDDCGHIFLGSKTTVNQYNSSLALVNTYAEPDTIYDLRLSTTNVLYACGIDFITSQQMSLPSCHVITVVNDIKNVDCDTLGSAVVTPSGGTPPYTIIWNTAPVQTGTSVTGLKAGTYVATITDSSCQKQTYLDTIAITSNAITITPTSATICNGNSVDLTISGGATSYSWSPTTGLGSTSGSSVNANPTTTSTYTVIGTSAAGCLDTVKSVVTVNATPTISVPAPTAICVGSSIALNASGATTYVWTPSTGLSATSGSSVTANPTTTITYTITGTNTVECTGTTTVTVIVNPKPVINVATPLPICNGTNTTLTASGGTTYAWTPSTGLSATSGSSVSANPTTNSTYTITGTNGNGCSSTTTVDVAVNPNPTISVPAPAAVCLGSSVSLTASGAATYAWTPSTGLSATSGSSVNANPTTSTTYTITGTNGSGCSATTIVVVTINPTPVITVSGPVSICNGSSTILTASGASTYTWSPATGLSATTGSSVTANPITTTTYTVTGTTAAGCVGTATIVVTVNPLPIITVPSVTICLGDSTTLTASGASTYTWTPATGLSATTGSSVIATPPSTATYTIVGTDVNGCTATTTSAVTVNPVPVVNVANAALICFGNNTTIVASGALNYTWSPSAGLNTTTGATVIVSPTVTTTYTVTGTNSFGCPVSKTVVATVIPTPTIAVNAPVPMCEGGSATLVASGGVSYFWSPSAGLSSSTGSSVITNPTITTTYFVTGIGADGCSNTTPVLVFIYPTPVIVVPTPPATCSGSGVSATLTASGASTYTWSPSTALSATSGSSVIANSTVTTTYTIDGTDTNGCVGSTTVVITINPLPVIAVNTPLPICLGSSTNLTSAGAKTYAWTPSTGLSATTGSSVIANPTTTTTYTVSGIDSNGCVGIATVIVKINPLPVITANGATAICTGDSVVLTSGGGSSYTWSPSTGLNSTTGTSVIANPTATTTYTVTGTDSNGCVNSATIVVTINPLPIITINNPGTICNGSSTNLTANGATSYTWTPSTGLSATTGSSVVANPTVTTTYIITGTNINGCVGTDSVVVSVNLPIIVTVNSVAPICIGSSAVITASGAGSYTWTPATGLSATAGSSVVANPTTTTTYTITGTDANDCNGVTTVIVIVNPLPIITSTNPTPICDGSSTILTASGGTTYTWAPSTGLSATTGSSVTASPTTSSTYTITGTDINGCSATATSSVTINPLPIITAPAQAPICIGTSATLTASGGTTYTWTPSTALSATTGSSVNADPTVSTTYTITGIDGNGCSSSTTIDVVVNPLPIIAVPTPAPICIGTSTILTASGGTTYTWTPSAGLSSSTGSSITANPTTSSTYTITGIDSNGCSSSTTVVVAVNPSIAVNVATPSPICIGSSATLTANGANSYTWTPSTGLSATTGSSVTANPTTNSTYTIVGTDGSGCTATTTVDVVVNPNPVISVATPAPICIGTSTALTANGGTTYIWTPATGLSGTTGSSVNANPTTSSTYTITGIDSNGCSATTTVDVTINPLPIITVPTPAPICTGTSTTLTANGGTTYTWTPATGLSATTGSSVTANPPTSSTYTITGTDVNGCSATTTVDVAINPLPVITAATPAPICTGTSITLTAGGGATYTWTPSTGLSATTGSSVTAEPTASATYTITGTDGNGCISSTTVDVVVNPNPVIAVAPPAPICPGTSTTLTANGGTTYVWTPSTGLSATTGSSVTASPTANSTYTITGTDGNGCTATTTVAVTINPNISLTIATPAPLCIGNSDTLVVNGANNYTWTPSTGLSATTGSSVIANPTTNSTYTIVGTDGSGCTATTTVSITVNPNPVINVATPAPMCNGNSTTLTVNGATTYIWTPSTGLSASTGSSVNANPTSSTTYIITGTDGNGCLASTNVDVVVNPNPVIAVAPPAPICPGTSTTLAANGGTTYVWTPSTGLSASTGSSVTASPTANSTYTITGTDSNGCTGTTTVAVTINPNISLAIATPAPLCIGNGDALVINGANNYTWTPSTGLSATTGSSVIANPTINSTYTIVGTDGSGCTATTTVDVTVNPNPIINVATPAPMCNGNSTTLIANGGTTFTWTPSTGLSASTGSSVNANPTISSTYTITGTNGNGCSSTTTVDVTVNPNPVIAVPIPAPICTGTSTTLSTNGATTYIWTPSTGLSATSGSSVTANPTTNTTYTITGTNGNGCTATTTVDVVVNPNPVIAVPTPSPICSGTSTTLSASGGTIYFWTPSAGLSATTGSTVNANPTESSTYTITGTDGNGCSSVTTVDVDINPNPVITIATPAPMCIGASTILSANGASTYTWTPSVGLSSTTGSSVTANPTASGTYTIFGTNGNGCSSSTTVDVTVNPNPVISVATPLPICAGTNTTLIAVGGTTYAWTPSTGLSATSGSSVTANPATSSTYTITGTNSNGCSSSTTVDIAVNPNPQIIAETNGPICSGSNTTITALGATTYTWSPSAGLSATSGSSVTADPKSTSTYLITGTDSNGCVSTVSATVIVNSNPAIIVSKPGPICNGASVPLTANGAVAYSWVPSTGLNTTTGSSVIAGPPTSVTYTITGTDANGCQATAQISVQINQNPSIVLNNPPPFCLGASATLVVEGANSYSWTPAIGLSSSTGDSVIADPSNSTTYTVTGVDSNGCLGRATVSVIVNPKPKLSANNPPPVCNGNSDRLEVSGAQSYLWSPATSLSASSGSMVIATPSITTTYSVVGMNDNGCADTANLSVAVNLDPVVSVFGLNPLYCINTSPVTLTATPPGGTFSGNGVEGSQFYPDSAGGDGIYSINYVYKDSNGCIGSATTQVTVAPLPKLYLTPSNPTVCSGIPVLLSVSGGTSYVWSPNTGLSDSTSSNVSASPTTTTTYVITGTNTDGCSDTVMVTVNVDSMPKASFDDQTLNYCEPLGMQFINTSTAGDTYSWDFGDGSSSGEFNPQHTYNQGGTYQVQLIVTSPHGCVDNITKEITVTPGGNDLVMIGDAFTPTSGDINSTITPNVLCQNLSNFVFRVYNRYGQLLFQTYTTGIGWDGRFNGQMEPVGVYDYYIEFNCSDCKIFKKGNITLIK